MSHAHLRKALAASLLGAALATPAVALELFGPSCLEKLTERTRLWAECTHAVRAYRHPLQEARGENARLHAEVRA